MRKMMQRSLSCLLTLAMVVTMLMTSTLAAEKSAKLEFDYSANYESSKVVSLEVYKGYPCGEAFYPAGEQKMMQQGGGTLGVPSVYACRKVFFVPSLQRRNRRNSKIR